MKSKTPKKETTLPPAGEFAVLPLDRIAPSPHNARKTFDKDELQRLTESIREKGVLEPVIVRPKKWSELTPFKELHASAGTIKKLDNLLDKDHAWRVAGTVEDLIRQLDDHGGARTLALHKLGLSMTEGTEVAEALYMFEQQTKEKLGYELVAGERRYRASRLAGLDTIPAIVRDLDDKAAAEVGVIENDQRADVPPLEQAEGYGHLITLGDDAETIAAKIGRPLKYVAGRLQLLHLAPPLQEDLRKGKLPFGHAWLLSRLSAGNQDELRKNLYEQYGMEPGRPISIAELKRKIRNNALHPLSAAPWKWADAELVPAAGPCTTCPKRSGNNRTLFDELIDEQGKKKKDEQEYCTDGACYRGKRTAFVELQVRKTAEANGGETMRISERWSSETKGVLGRDKYEIVSAKEAKAAKPGTVQQAVIVEEGYQAEGKLGKVVHVRLTKEQAGKSSNGASDSYKREEAARKKKAEAGRAASQLACAQVAAKMEAAMEGPNFLPLLRHVMATLADACGADICRTVGKRRGLTVDPNNVRDAVEQFALVAPDELTLIGLAAELAAARHSWTWGASYSNGHMGEDEKAFWKAFGVDKAKLVAKVEAEQKEKKAAKSKPAKRKAAQR